MVYWTFPQQTPTMRGGATFKHSSFGTIALTGFFLIIIIPSSTAGFDQLNTKQQNDIFLLVYTNIGVFIGSALFYLVNRFIQAGSQAPCFDISPGRNVIQRLPCRVNGRTEFVRYAIPTMMASMLLYSWASFIFAGLSGLTVVIVAYFGGTHPNELAIIGYFFIAFVSWLSSRTQEQALHEVRTINADLDKVVAERTHALSESLARERVEAGRNQAILDSIADGVIVFDANYVSILANPALSHLTETPFKN